MAKCQIEGCTKDAYYNHITGESNIVCTHHLNKIRSPRTKNKSPKANKLPFRRGDKPPFSRNKPAVSRTPQPEVFVLRGHTLTINYTGKTKHVNVNRLTRAVKYNDDKEGTSGKMFHYIIDIKQGTESIADVLFDNKAERDREFAKLQAILSKL
jgi:hypothetical protein